MIQKKDEKTLTLSQTQQDEIADDRPPLDLKLLFRLFTYSKPYARSRNILFLMVLIRAIQLPTAAWAIGAIINGPITKQDLHGTILGAFAFMALIASIQIILHFRQKLALLLGENVIHDIRRDIFQHLLNLPLAFFDKTKLGRIISRITSDVEAVRYGIQNSVFVSMVLFGQMVVSAIYMFLVDHIMFLILLGLAPIIFVMNYFYRRKMSEAARKRQESFSRVTSTLAESVNGIRVTQGFVRQDVNAEIFSRLVLDHSTYNLMAERVSAVFVPLLDFNAQIFIGLLLFIGGYRVLSPDIEMSIGNLVQFIFLAGVFFEPFQNLGRIYDSTLSAMAGAERVFHVLDSKPEWQDDPNATELPSIRGEVSFQHVNFEYEKGIPVLHDINIDVEPGQLIALVGHTGCGKSSIINLLAKFYLPSSGQVLIDNHDIMTVTSDSIHHQMGIIQQENFLFSGTIMENIRLGKPEATDAEITEAAQKLDCLDLIENLPEGFQTQVGENGNALSLGQRQIVCFIRAMVASPQILILDEATSSVDAMTEARIQVALERLMKGRTSFVVAHRLSTIRNADEVLVMDHGRIVERGSHIELLDHDGVYARLYKQFIQVGN